MDFVSGPFIYYGPDFATGREFYAAETLSPSTDFPSIIDNNGPAQRGAGNWVAFAGEFTGDGWPDVLLANTSGSALYVNPKGARHAGGTCTAASFRLPTRIRPKSTCWLTSTRTGNPTSSI
jgi:hypothetical protein